METSDFVDIVYVHVECVYATDVQCAIQPSSMNKSKLQLSMFGDHA